MDFDMKTISKQKKLIDDMLVNIHSNSSFSHLMYTKNPYRSILDHVYSLGEDFSDVHEAMSKHRMYTEIKMKRVRAQR